MRRQHAGNDGGFTLVELLICVALVGVLATVTSSAIVVALRTTPAVEDRADASVNVQGLVTWLPQDVDSATPDSFDAAPGTPSGCSGADPGQNLLKMAWTETISATANYVVSYRYVPESIPSKGGRLVRVYCVAGTAPQTLKMSGLIPPWIVGSEPVKVLITDSPDTDARKDTIKFSVEPIRGKTIVITGTTKNLNESLPPPAGGTTPPETVPANQPPVGVGATYSITSGTPLAVSVSGTDPEGLAVTATIPGPPAGWTVTSTGSLSFNVTAPATADNTTVVIPFTVTDPGGQSGSANLTFNVVPPVAVNQPPVANPSSGSTTAGTPVVVPLSASDPEGGALTVALTSVPSGWTATIAALKVTVTPPATAVAGSSVIGYKVTDPSGATASSTLTITITAPPTCVISTPSLDRSTVSLKKNDPDALTNEVTVTITIVSGYCSGLSLNYDTGAPNGKYIRNFPTSGTTRSVTLPNHPSPELWSSGTKTLVVKDSTNLVIGSVNLGVTP
jgi:prepilin-type N-terminal cleavage/methylation domain-containing protein